MQVIAQIVESDGRTMKVRVIADLEGFRETLDPNYCRNVGDKRMHPFWRYSCHMIQCLLDDPDDLAEEQRWLWASVACEKTDQAVIEEIVADNAVTRSLVAAINQIDTLNTANTSKDDYMALLVLVIHNCWD